MANDDVAKLKKALDSERAKHKETDGQLKAANARITELEAGAPKLGEGDSAAKVNAMVDIIVKARLASAGIEHQKKIATLEIDLLKSQEQNKALLGDVSKRTIADTVKEAAKQMHVRDNVMSDLLTFANLELKMDGHAVVTADGRSVEQWLDAQKETRGWMWPVSKGARAQGSGGALPASLGANPWNKDTWDVTGQSVMTRDKPAIAELMMASAKANGTMGRPR
jgi:hypothetical protein